MAKKKKKKLSFAQAANHVSNLYALATSLRGGKGPHKTSKKDNKKIRKLNKIIARQLEG